MGQVIIIRLPEQRRTVNSILCVVEEQAALSVLIINYFSGQRLRGSTEQQTNTLFCWTQKDVVISSPQHKAFHTDYNEI